MHGRKKIITRHSVIQRALPT